MEQVHGCKRFSWRAFVGLLALMLGIGLTPMLLDGDTIWYDWWEQGDWRCLPAFSVVIARFVLFLPLFLVMPLDHHGFPPHGIFLALGIPWALAASVAGAFAIGWLNRFRERLARDGLEPTPVLFGKAARLLLVASILPWSSPVYHDIPTGLLWGGTMAEKLVGYLAVWLLLQSRVLKHGGTAPAPLGSLGHRWLARLAIFLALASFYPFVTGTFFFLEKSSLLLAGWTLAHLYDHERGSRLEPIFLVLFLVPLVGGFLSILTVSTEGLLGLATLVLGTLPVTLAGSIAMYAMLTALARFFQGGDERSAAL